MVLLGNKGNMVHLRQVSSEEGNTIPIKWEWWLVMVIVMVMVIVIVMVMVMDNGYWPIGNFGNVQIQTCICNVDGLQSLWGSGHS